ncbi:MAG: hypothetical protein ACRD8A_03620 [Candidatus Acidiferrales bacterium]
MKYVLWWHIFMLAQNHATPKPAPEGVPLSAFRNKIRPSSSITFTTLGDGHAVPSIFAATPAASTKIEKLMDTLFASIKGRNVALRARQLNATTGEHANISRPKDTNGRGLFSTRVLSKNPRKSSSINKRARIGRHTLERLSAPRGGLSK